MDQNLAILLAVFADGPYFSAFFLVCSYFVRRCCNNVRFCSESRIAASHIGAGSKKQHPLPQLAGHLGAGGVAMCRFASAMPCLRRSFEFDRLICSGFVESRALDLARCPGCPRGPKFNSAPTPEIAIPNGLASVGELPCIELLTRLCHGRDRDAGRDMSPSREAWFGGSNRKYFAIAFLEFRTRAA
jgi:hypothetical protein